MQKAQPRMSSVQDEIAAIEERLRTAELRPDPDFFESVIADDAVLVSQDGVRLSRPSLIDAHRESSGANLTRVEMRDLTIVDHGDAAVVTCEGTFESPRGRSTQHFMRVWLKKDGRWQIVAASVAV
jgi:ketosteroid isomerase-like protein